MLRSAYKYIFFILFLALGKAKAQDTYQYGEDAYVPDSIVAVRNAVKIDPVQIFFGDYRIYYERILYKGFSVQMGTGITRRNYAADWFDYSLDNLGDNVDIKTGYSLSLSLRKYLVDYAELNGWYLSLGAEMKEYKTDYTVIDGAGEITDFVFEDRRQLFATRLNLGYQALPISSNLFADFYAGISLRVKDYNIVQAEDIHIPSTYSIVKLEESVVGFQLGVRLGVGF